MIAIARDRGGRTASSAMTQIMNDVQRVRMAFPPFGVDLGSLGEFSSTTNRQRKVKLSSSDLEWLERYWRERAASPGSFATEPENPLWWECAHNGQ